MSNLAGAILNGLSIAGSHWQLVLGLLLILFVSQGSLIFVFRKIFDDQFSSEETISISLAGWLFPATLLALLWYFAARIVSLQFSTAAIGILLLLGLLLSILAYRKILPAFNAIAISLLILALVFLTLRLAFVSRAVFPLYFDSALHYQFIRGVLASLGIPGTGNFTLPGYYHLGFHFLAAFLTVFTRAEITDTMLVLGQVILALMPFSMFFIVRYGTHSNTASFFALTLAAFGWYMPAHAVDWGKYPALASVAMIPFVVSLAALSIQSRRILSSQKYFYLMLLLLASAFASVVLHSRSLIVYFLLGITWLINSLRARLSQRAQLLLLGLFFLILAGEISYIQSRGILGPLFDAYGQKSIFIGAVILVLSFFAWQRYPGLVFFCIVSVALLVASLFVPIVNLVPGFPQTTLLDRPYVQMLLYLPLTLLGGFGLAALEQLLQNKNFTWRNTHFAWGKAIGGLLILFVTVNALFQYNLYPANCCALVSRDDLAAIQWMDQNLPADSLILTSSTDMNVLPTDKVQGSAGGDGGTWITPLTGRPVAFMPYNTDFNQPQIFSTLCSQKIKYIYVGKTGWFFDDTGMGSQPNTYQLILDLPKAKVYEVAGCP